MRQICKDCTLSNVHKFGKCECPESKAYDSGYNDAIEKACEWWRAELDVDVDETYQSWIDETLSRFLKAMLNENKY